MFFASSHSRVATRHCQMCSGCLIWIIILAWIGDMIWTSRVCIRVGGFDENSNGWGRGWLYTFFRKWVQHYLQIIPLSKQTVFSRRRKKGFSHLSLLLWVWAANLKKTSCIYIKYLSRCSKTSQFPMHWMRVPITSGDTDWMIVAELSPYTWKFWLAHGLTGSLEKWMENQVWVREAE